MHYLLLTVPGSTGSGPDHWHTHWERAYPSIVRVQQDDWDHPDREDWVDRLDAYVQLQTSPVVLVAHSCGAAAAVHWAASRGPGPVIGAFLVAPADADVPTAVPAARAFAPLPSGCLPFPTVLVTSNNDPHLDLVRAYLLGARWGSHVKVMRGAGHFNTASGHGPWPEGYAMLDQFCHSLGVTSLAPAQPLFPTLS